MNIKKTTITYVMLFVIFSCGTVRSIPALGPGMEWNIYNLIYDNEDRYPLPGDWVIEAYSYNDHDIYVDFKGENRKGFSLRIAVAQVDSTNPDLGHTTNFVIENPDGKKLSGEEIQVANSFIKRLNANDSSILFISDEMRNKESFFLGMFQKRFLSPLIVIMFLILITGVVVERKIIIKNLLPENYSGKLLLFMIALSALYIRIDWIPDSVIHNNGHGIREIRAVVYPESREQKEIMYDVVYIKIMRSLIKITGSDYSGIFSINKVFGALSVIAIYMAAVSFSGSFSGAFIPAVVMGFVPAIMWLSASESPITMYLFFALTGISFLILSFKEDSKLLFVTSVVLIAIASSMRFLTLLIVPSAFVMVVCYFVSEHKKIHLSRSIIATSAILLAGWCALHYYALSYDNLLIGAARLSVPVYLNNMKNYNIFNYALLIPPIVLFAGAVGFIIMTMKSIVKSVGLATIFLILVPASFTCMADTTDLVRYQSAAIWILFISASFIPEIAGDNKFRKYILSFIISILIIIQCYPGIAALRSGDEEHDEIEFIEKFVKQNDVKEIYLPVNPDNSMNVEFPDYVGKIKLNRSNTAIKTFDSDVYIYLGLDCYRYNEQKNEIDGVDVKMIRPECTNICEHGMVETKEIILRPRGLRGVYRRYYPLSSDSLKVGFYKCLSK